MELREPIALSPEVPDCRDQDAWLNAELAETIPAAPVTPVSAAEEAFIPFETEEPAEIADFEPLGDDDLLPAGEATIAADEPTPIEPLEEEEFTGFEMVEEEEDPGKTQTSPFQFPDPAPPKKDAGGWDFLASDDKSK